MRLACLLAILAPGVARAGLVFNEINADPDADASCSGGLSTTGDEFVEIVNTGPGSVDLTGATLSDLTGPKYTFGAAVLQEGQAVVLFGGDDPALDGSATGLGPWCVDVGPDVFALNAGGSLSLNNTGDDLTLLASDGSTVLAFVSYPSSAGDNQSIVLSPEFFGGSYVKHTTVGLDPFSPGRMADGGPIDLTASTTPTGGGCDGAGDVQGVVINEFVANPAGTDTDLEWVEVYNGSGGPADLSGWMIAAGTSSYGVGDPLPPGSVLGAGQYLVIGQTPIPEVDVVAGGFSLGNASSNSDAVQLRDCYGDPADTVVYGDPNDDLWEDDTGGVADSTAPKPPDGGSLARDPDGRDTDDSGSDFVALTFPTPGDANDAPPPSCGGPESGIKINELMPNPEGADEGAEWIEIFHAGSAPVDLTDWALQAGTSSFSTKYTWLGGTLNPGDRLLLGGEFVPDTDAVVDFGMGNGTNADGVRLVDCFGFPADTVIYGAPNDGDPPFTDDTGGVATSLAPTPGEGASLQRVRDGYDTDQSGIDFAVTLEPSPGAENPEVEPVQCVPSDGSVVINEFLPDPDGDDAGLEWIELHNSSSIDVSVAGWMISAGTQDYEGRDIVLGGGVMIPARGFLVIGGVDVDFADVQVPFSLGNGTGTDGLRLFDCEDDPVDTVLYGEDSNEDLMQDDEGMVVEPYGDPGSEESLARIEDGVDTDTSEDWTEKARPTPGASNIVEIGPVDDPISGGCGCGGGAPDAGTGPQAADPEAGGCSTAPVPPGAFQLLLIGIVSVARRRRR